MTLEQVRKEDAAAAAAAMIMVVVVASDELYDIEVGGKRRR
jgi:hypothetical protein